MTKHDYNKRTKFAILGKLESKYYAPYDDESWVILTMGLHKDHELLQRVDRCFDIHLEHKVENFNADIKRDEFPIDECKKLVGGNYFCTTSAYLIAYAILHGATEISLYGMRFDIDHDRRLEEKRNVREMVFFARGRGIKVYDYDGIVTKEYDEVNDGVTDFDG